MTELLTAAQMRAIEQAAIASGEVTGLELMERAGRGVVEAIFEEWPELKATSHRAVVLCGPGNNGGDGFVVARLLKEWGWEVEVFLYGDPEKMPPGARVNYERWVGMGDDVKRVDALPYPSIRDSLPWLNCLDEPIIVDALFGICDAVRRDEHLSGLIGELCGLHSGSEYLTRTRRVVAVDLPSGIGTDTGKVILQEYFMGRPLAIDESWVKQAQLTVTFEYSKVGHHIGFGPEKCGKLVIKPIGLSKIRAVRQTISAFSRPGNIGWVTTFQLDSAHSRDRARDRLGRSVQGQPHKYSHGHALILSGPSGRGGAARLAARGALRIGAGVVTVGCPPDAIPEHAARLDAVMLRGVADGLMLEETLEDPRINTLCVGPGLGLDARGRELVEVALGCRGTPRPTGDVGRGVPRRSLVLDADALTILSQHPDLFAALHNGCVLTPHAGEFARLFPDIAEKLGQPATKGPAYSKVDATREAAKRAGCVVLYKGPDTVIAGPDGRCAINSAHYDRAAPWLATAGSGDVLAGFITGLLARGFSPFDAACTGAWLHVECALSFGPGLIAEDLPEELPKVFRALGM